MTESVIIAIISAISGGFGWQIISAFVLPKKDEKEADKAFIDTLIQRITMLEGRLEEQSKQLTSVMEENARLKVEMEYLRRENDELRKEAKGS
jgi:predicted RNase H-like nuclease (RuvC/YqgF family)